MALELSSNLTTLVNCNADGNWAGDPTIDADTELYKEPTASIGVNVDIETLTIQCDLNAEIGSNQNLADTIIYFWIIDLAFHTADTWENGGHRMRLVDGAGNWSEWYVGGSDSYFGGWKRYVVNVESTPDAVNGALDLTDVRYFGVTFKHLQKFKATLDSYVDYVQYHRNSESAYIITNGAAEPRDFAEWLSKDEAIYAGLVREDNGVYFLNGPIEFGDSTAPHNLQFADTNQILVTENLYRTFGTANRPAAESLVGPNHFQITIGSNAGCTTSFQLGTKAGVRGVQGCVLKSGGNRKLKFLASDSDIDTLKIYGTTMHDVDVIDLPPNAANRELLDCNFIECGEIFANTCVVKYSNIINADLEGLRIINPSFNVTYCTFINCPRAVNIIEAGEYTFDNLQFTGNTYDIHFSDLFGDLIINCNDSNPSDAKVLNDSTGIVTIINTVTLKVTVKDRAGNPITDAQTAIYKLSDNTELMNEDTALDGEGKAVATEAFNYPGSDVDVYIRVRKSTVGNTRYQPHGSTGVITASGLDIVVTLYQEPVS